MNIDSCRQKRNPAGPSVFLFIMSAVLMIPLFSSCQTQGRSKEKKTTNPTEEYPPLNINWDTWEGSDQGTVNEMKEHLRFIGTINSREERQEKAEKFDRAVDALDQNPRATKAAAAELMRQDVDDTTRIVCYKQIRSKGNPHHTLLAWLLGKLDAIDPHLHFLFWPVHKMARKQNEAMIPGLLEMLRLKEQTYFMVRHYWKVPTRDVLMYTVGSYGRDISPHLVPELKSDNAYVARNAAFLLGYFCYEPAEEALIQTVKREDRAAGGAAFALGHMRVKRAYDEVLELLQSDLPTVRYWATYALMGYQKKEAISEIKKAMKGEEVESVKQYMNAALDELKNPPEPLSGATPVSENEVEELIKTSMKENGLDINQSKAAKLVRSYEKVDLSDIENIRQKTMNIASDMGNKSLREWNWIYRKIWHRKNDRSH